MAEPFLYQTHVLAEVFSVSASLSEKVPALQVRVEARVGLVGVMLGAPKVGVTLG